MWFLILIPIAYLLVQSWQLYQFYKYNSPVFEIPTTWPEISIWVAARNEEENIENCLTHLLNMDYPKDKIQILVGNDQSTDKTKEIATLLSEIHPQIKVIDIVENVELKAKARVMAQLDTHAIGEFYLVTDADVCVKPTWAKELISQLEPNMGVASGTTMVIAPNFWGKMQSIDWAYFMGLLNIISFSGVPATAVGNNMIIRKKAYWETGGYSAIKFSITEDYKLYSEVCAKGWKWKNIMNAPSLAYSLPTKGFINLLHQRKRWLSGGQALPWYWWLLFGIFGLYYFCIPLVFIFFPLIAICLVLVKISIQNLHILKIYTLLKEPKPSWLTLILYEIYLSTVTVSTAIFYVLPIATNWKGRKY